MTGLDIKPSPFTHKVGAIQDRSLVRQLMKGVDAVLHTATLHKPHVVTHTYHDFIATNMMGTLTLLEEAAIAGVKSFIFTSTTSTFGDALRPGRGDPAVWVTEDIWPLPKNIYGLTMVAAEDLCRLFHRKYGLACLILRTSRFFPEEDDQKAKRQTYADANIKANEMLFRRVDLEDAVHAHILASEKAQNIGFGRYIISATTPFLPKDLPALNKDAPSVVREKFPDYADLYQEKNWSMFPSIERVYVNEKARRELGWSPKYNFQYVLDCLKSGIDFKSPLSHLVGSKGYHAQIFEDGPYPVEE